MLPKYSNILLKNNYIANSEITTSLIQIFFQRILFKPNIIFHGLKQSYIIIETIIYCFVDEGKILKGFPYFYWTPHEILLKEMTSIETYFVIL